MYSSNSARTWDVDLTITNILEGLVPYVPEGQGPSVPSPSQRASVDQVNVVLRLFNAYFYDHM